MYFDIVFEKQEEGGYTVYVPALQGCISEGDTKSQAMKNIKEAISLYLEELGKSELKKLSKSVSVEKTRVKSYA
ncbi:MAG: type II toxin-antitoxin system HicB family antitoxin [archaeon]|nr:type II toxin-antitoxin system HicB family antitoxin [archaeon]